MGLRLEFYSVRIVAMLIFLDVAWLPEIPHPAWMPPRPATEESDICCVRGAGMCSRHIDHGREVTYPLFKIIVVHLAPSFDPLSSKVITW